MKALLSRQPGGPETLTLEDVPDPKPGRGEVRIRVRAVGVNFPDLLIIQDLYQIKPPRPFSPGGELAGVVEALGEGVTSLKTGDRVLVSPVRSAMAEKAIAQAGNCWKIPDAMPFDEAAALLMTYGTSQHALEGSRSLAAPARPCWCSAPPAVSDSRPWNWARRWAPASSLRPRARKSWRWRASTAPTRACSTPKARSTRMPRVR